MKAVDSEKCSECSIATETVKYLILHCPNSELCKIVGASCKSLGIEPKIEIALSHERLVDTIHKQWRRKQFASGGHNAGAKRRQKIF